MTLCSADPRHGAAMYPPNAVTAWGAVAPPTHCTKRCYEAHHSGELGPGCPTTTSGHDLTFQEAPR